MKALIEINVYGGNTLLATLTKHDDLPTGIYSDRPVKSLINLTPGVQAIVMLKIEKVSLNGNDTSLLVSDKRLQLTELLQTLGIQNFVAFVKDAEHHGWIVEKYIDSINRYFHIDNINQPLTAPAIISESILSLFLFALMTATPAVDLKLMSSGYMASPFWVFALFLGLTTVVYFFSFGIMQFMRNRDQTNIPRWQL